MFDPVCDLIARPETLDAQSANVRERSPEQANSYTCPHCSYVNWCTFDSGHSGNCHCDQGHYWAGNH
ncbi:MAG: hypothetical protein ACXW27_05500 [Allosphingosinicella sp.]